MMAAGRAASLGSPNSVRHTGQRNATYKINKKQSEHSSAGRRRGLRTWSLDSQLLMQASWKRWPHTSVAVPPPLPGGRPSRQMLHTLSPCPLCPPSQSSARTAVAALGGRAGGAAPPLGFIIPVSRAAPLPAAGGARAEGVDCESTMARSVSKLRAGREEPPTCGGEGDELSATD